MSTEFEIVGRFREDGSASLLGRVTARDGTGATQASGRKLLQQADVSTITLKVFDLDSSTPTTSVYTPSLTVSSIIYNTLQTTWDVDETGFNLKIDIPSTVFTDGGHVYLCEVKITTTGSTVAFAHYKGPAVAVYGS